MLDKIYARLRCCCVVEFIDRRDSSLAFAAFGAICYESFPTAIIKVSRNREPEEFLLCFNGRVTCLRMMLTAEHKDKSSPYHLLLCLVL